MAQLQYILMKERVMLLKSLISMGTNTSLEDKGQTHISGEGRHKRHTPRTCHSPEATLRRVTESFVIFFFHLGGKLTGLSKQLKTTNPKHMCLDIFNRAPNQKQRKQNKNAVTGLLKWKNVGEKAQHRASQSTDLSTNPATH